MGNFPIQAKFINKMVILDKYLFVFDADASIAAFSTEYMSISSTLTISLFTQPGISTLAQLAAIK